MSHTTEPARGAGKRRRWLLAIDPFFEGGRTGSRARAWDVDDELIAVAILGDVTIDLSEAKSTPNEIKISAYAIFRDVEVIVPEGAGVELFGGAFRGDLVNKVAPASGGTRQLSVTVHGHALLGDVEIRHPEKSD